MTNDQSRAALLGFLDYLAKKGLMNSTTVSSRKAAVSRVLGILSDDEAADVSAIDLDDVMRRFMNLEGSKFTPDSLATYKSRLKSSIEDFLTYQQNPLAFKAGATTAVRKTRERGDQGAPRPRDAVIEQKTQPSQGLTVVENILPVPIRSELTIYIQGLPFDLTKPEANKIANVIKAMAGEE